MRLPIGFSVRKVASDPGCILDVRLSPTSCHRVSRSDFNLADNFVLRSILTPCASPTRYSRPRRYGRSSRNSSPVTARTVVTLYALLMLDRGHLSWPEVVRYIAFRYAEFAHPKTPLKKEAIMSKAMSYVAVGAVAFLVGGFSFRLISRAEDGKAEPKHTAIQENSREANAAVPRYFTIEGMTCQGCADSIAAALTGIPNVRSAKVSLQDKRAVVLAEESQVPTKTILAAVAAAGYKGQLASAEQSTSATANTSGKQPILVNITRGKNELHAVSMALGLAQSAIKNGRPAVVFLNVEAPVFAAKDLGNDVKYADFPPVKKMLADFVAMGGRVLVCGHCAHVVKLEQRDMIDGAQVRAHDELFAAMPPGTVVFSY